MPVRKMVALSISLFLMMCLPALSTSEKKLLRSQDRVEIEQLMWEYIQALDSHDVEAFVNKFTIDGEFRSRDSTAKGRDSLKKMVMDTWKKMDIANKNGQKKPHMYHVVTNHHIEFIDKLMCDIMHIGWVC